jgi:hypothetical protein
LERLTHSPERRAGATSRDRRTTAFGNST